MSSEKLFKNFIELFKLWPTDKTKRGRCLGEYVRKKFTESFRQGENSANVDLKYWNKAYNDLLPIAENEFAKKYPRLRSHCATGLGKEQCKLVNSNETMKILKEDSG
jgi:mitochondrial nucleoid factor 1